MDYINRKAEGWVHSNIISPSHSHIHMLSTGLRNILLTKLMFLLLQSQLDKSTDSSTCRVKESWGQPGLFLICPRGQSSGQIWCLEAAETALAAGFLEVMARALFMKKKHSQLEAMTHNVHINQITLHIINRPLKFKAQIIVSNSSTIDLWASRKHKDMSAWPQWHITLITQVAYYRILFENKQMFWGFLGGGAWNFVRIVMMMFYICIV